jgi:SAM-dependent methyltransferase
MTSNPWDPASYDTTYGFVSRYGDDVLALLDASPGQRILDLGCGTGRHAGVLAAAGVEVVGVDQDERMLDKARAEVPSVTFVRVDARAFGPDDVGRFDGCFSNAALHWMTPQDAVLRNVRSVLLPGGRFVAEMGGWGNIAAMDASLREALRDVGHGDVDVPTNYFPTIGEQAVALESAGFRVRSMAWFPRPTPLAPGTTAADWTRHFRAMVWERVPESAHASLADAVDGYARQRGLAHDDGWVADYCRLRFVAVAT